MAAREVCPCLQVQALHVFHPWAPSSTCVLLRGTVALVSAVLCSAGALPPASPPLQAAFLAAFGHAPPPCSALDRRASLQLQPACPPASSSELAAVLSSNTCAVWPNVLECHPLQPHSTGSLERAQI
jgi:hypothetical protein